MNALDQLAELLRYAEHSKEEVRLLRAELVALQARVEKLEGSPPAPSKRRPAEPAAPPAPRPEPVIHVRREATPPSAPPSVTPTIDPARHATLLARYAEAVLDLSGAGEAFVVAHQPVAVLRIAGSDEYVVGGDPYDAMLWAVRSESGGHVLLPGYKAINNWSGHFAPNRTTTAAQYFGHAFDLDPGSPRLTVAAPALARETAPGRLTLLSKGRLSGFRA